MAASAGLFLDGLLGEERRKTGWMRAEAAGDPGPWRQQAVLGRSLGCGRTARRRAGLRRREPCGGMRFWSIDETGFLKQGKNSCGVARQYTGSAGKITNCQIGVFAAYVSAWSCVHRSRPVSAQGMDGRSARMAPRMCRPGRPSTKPRLARTMIERAIAAEYRSPGWRPIPSMASANRDRACAGPARAMCSASSASTSSAPGASSRRRRHGRADRTGSGRCRLAAPVGWRWHQRRPGSMIGRTAPWPISMPPNTMAPEPDGGRAGF